MAATIRGGHMGPLGLTSVRPAGASQGSMLQHPHVPSVEAKPEANRRSVFTERTSRLFETPFMLHGDSFGVKDDVPRRETARKLYEESSEDQCEIAVTVTSEIFSDAEGCYELTEDDYYITADNEHLIALLPITNRTETEELHWIYGWVSHENNLGELIIQPVCFYEDDNVLPGEIDIWQCDLVGNGVNFTEVEAEDFSTSCGCSTSTEDFTTILPTEAGTHSGDTPAPSAGATRTSSMTEEVPTPIPTEAGTHDEDTPAPSEKEMLTASMNKEAPTPIPTEAGTHGGGTPAPSEGMTMTASITEEPAEPIPTQAGTHGGDTPGPSEGATMTVSMTEEPATLDPTEAGTHGGDTSAPSGDIITHSPTPAVVNREIVTTVPASPQETMPPMIGTVMPISSTFSPSHSSTKATLAPTQHTAAPTQTIDPIEITQAPTLSSISTDTFPSTSATYAPTDVIHAPASVVNSPSPNRLSGDMTRSPISDDDGFDGSASPSGSPTLGGFNAGSPTFPKMSIFGIVVTVIVTVVMDSISHVLS